MKRQEPPRRMGWRGPLAVIGVTVVALSALLVGVAIYSCDIDDIQDVRDLSDGLQTLIAREKGQAGGGALGGPHRHVMQVQGRWNGMTLAGPEPQQPAVPVGAGMGMGVAAGRPREGALVTSIDAEEGDRAQRAGIRPGDTIVGVDEQKIGGLADLKAVSQKLNAREPLMIHILRQGQLHTVVLPAEQPPLQSMPAAMNGPNAYCPRDGVLVPAAQAGSGVCPICGGPLHVYNPNVQGVQ